MKEWILLGIVVIALVFVSGCVQEETSKIDFVFTNNLDHDILIRFEQNYDFIISKENTELQSNKKYVRIELPSCSVCECNFAKEHGCAVCGQSVPFIIAPGENYTYIWNKDEIIEEGKLDNDITCVYTRKVSLGNYSLYGQYVSDSFVTGDEGYVIEKEFEVTKGNQTIIIDIKNATFVDTSETPLIRPEELEKGCYFGDYNQKKLATPDDWIWHEGGRSSHWAAPSSSLDDCWENNQTLSISVYTTFFEFVDGEEREKTELIETVQIENVTLPIDSEEKACELFIQVIESDKSKRNCTAIDKGNYWDVDSAPICEIEVGCPPSGTSGIVDKTTGNINNFKMIA